MRSLLFIFITKRIISYSPAFCIRYTIFTFQDRSIEFFEDCILDDTSLKNIMLNFSVKNVTSPNKPFFIEALCNQFYLIISAKENSVQNIVPSEYSKLISQASVVNIPINVSQEEYDEFTSTLDAVRSVLPDIIKLFNFFEKTNFFIGEAKDRMNDINMKFSTTSFINQDISIIIKMFCMQYQSFELYLVENFYLLDMKLWQLKSRRTNSYTQYSEIQKMRNVFRSSLYKIILFEKRLQRKEKTLRSSETKPGEYYYTEQRIVLKENN